ncbi:MAG: hypothetical protein Q7S92_07045 [Candidatus Diapherotrites archaeon]|nr:hypothetical protein [Candidatus Diapherotrites archaeon]
MGEPHLIKPILLSFVFLIIVVFLAAVAVTALIEGLLIHLTGNMLGAGLYYLISMTAIALGITVYKIGASSIKALDVYA